MFGGYPSIQRIPTALQAARWLSPVLPVTAMAASAVPDWRARKIQHFAGGPDVVSAYRAVRGNFMPEEWEDLLGPAFDGAPGRDAREALADFESCTFDRLTADMPAAAVSPLFTTVRQVSNGRPRYCWSRALQVMASTAWCTAVAAEAFALTP